MGQYKQQFLRSFDYIESLRQASPLNDNHWLLCSGPFMPDYFTIRHMGRNKWERLMNRYAPYWLGRWRPSYVVVSRFIGLFYDCMLPQDSESKQWLLNHLKRLPKPMSSWTLVLFFLFMEHYLRGLHEDTMNFSEVNHLLNQKAMDFLHQYQSKITRVSLSCRLQMACLANWFDVVVPQFSSTIDDSFQRIVQSMDQPEWGGVSQEMAAVNRAKSILYEVDNNGEIIFDLWVIQAMIQQNKSVTIVAKSANILNDATQQHVQEIIHQYSVFQPLKEAFKSGGLRVIIANDFPMVGKYLPLVLDAYKDAFRACDLVILKGQANFQTMPFSHYKIRCYQHQYQKPILYCFVAKSPMIQICFQSLNRRSIQLGDPVIYLI